MFDHHTPLKLNAFESQDPQGYAKINNDNVLVQTPTKPDEMASQDPRGAFKINKDVCSSATTF